MILDGTLTPECNFEVEYSNYDANSLKNEEEYIQNIKNVAKNFFNEIKK